MKKNTKYIVVTLALVSPVLAFAEPLDGVKGLLKAVGGLINKIIPVLFGLSLLYFFWGLAEFIRKDAGNEKTRGEGKQKMIWGVVALFVFVAIYGILNAIGGLIHIPISQSI